MLTSCSLVSYTKNNILLLLLFFRVSSNKFNQNVNYIKHKP